VYVSDNGNRKLGKFRRGASTGRFGEVYTEPGQAILTTQTDSRDTYLVREMHRLSNLIYEAKQRKDVPEVQRLLAEFRPLADEYRERGAIGVSPFDKFILATGEWVQQTLAAAGGLAKDAGVGLLKNLWPFAIVIGGLIYAKGKLL
jgi:hypothetical protein